MHAAELPMIIFTTIAQMSVGSMWFLGLVQLLGRRRGVPGASLDRLTNAGLYAAGPLLVLGFVAAFFHLSDPWHAPLTVLNIGSSWLSREIASGILYGVFGAVFACFQWFGWGSRRVRSVLAGLTALAGLALVASMCGVYSSLRTVPAWHTWFTWVLFFGSTLLTGSLAVVAAVAVSDRVYEHGSLTDAERLDHNQLPPMTKRLRGGPGASIKAVIGRGVFPPGSLEGDLGFLARRSVRIGCAVAAASGIVMLVAYPFHMFALGMSGDVTEHVARGMVVHGYLAVRLISLAVAVVLAAMAVFRQTAGRSPRRLLWLIVAALVVALCSELLGRGLHYEGLWHVGLNTVQR